MASSFHHSAHEGGVVVTLCWHCDARTIKDVYGDGLHHLLLVVILTIAV